jgi:methyl-accepting chemotaxis protein
VRWTLRPWLVAWEQELNRKLLTTEERKVYYFCHDLDDLERGDLQSRTAAYKEQFFNGKISLDEWRAKDNERPIGSPAGKIHFVQQAMIPVEIAAEGPQKPEPATAPDKQLQDTQKKLAAAILGDVMSRMVSMEINAVKRVAEKASKFDTRLKEFYDKHSVTLARNLSAPLSAALSANGDGRDVTEVLSTIIAAHVAESMNQLNLLTDCTADQLETKVTQCVDNWYDRLSTDLLYKELTNAN